jgi:hypothetical protein
MHPITIKSQTPTNDKIPYDEAARNRSKSNILRKVNEIKEALRMKGKQPEEEHKRD